MRDISNIAGYSQVQISVSTSAAHSTALEAGVYDVWCGVDVFVRIAPTTALADAVTAANGYKIFANTVVALRVARAGDYLGAIAGGAGTLSYHKSGT